ncbi:alpha/beta hydrolase [Streptacidiphilus carbonis]|uniref:alpha/beta hydrolase n=1 Tax=Streptacidiphilus carbonis TaxID=105422 RepID=UPI001269A499|nr:alpha/beta hydrolase [Streptacidiphilus carbonis]
MTGARAATGDDWQGQAALRAGLVVDADRLRLIAAGEQMQAMAVLLAQCAEELREAGEVVGAVLDGGGSPDDAVLRAAMARAAEVDGRCSAALLSSAAQARDGSALDLPAAATQLAAVTALVAAELPPRGSTPAEVRDWWEHLGADERRMLTTDMPQLIGSLDGVPCADRDRANRSLLDRLIDSEGDVDRLAALTAIRDRLRRQQGAFPPALLLAIGAEGQGRAVLAFGDPDHAADVSVYVPGMGTTLADVAGKDGVRALAIHDAAASASGARGPAASVVWLGYDPPPGLPGGASAARAVAGAASYGRFLAGLRATAGGASPHITAVGHSYGSLLVGKAAQRPGGIAADDIVLLGSPGTGAARAEQLGVEPGHVWAAAAPDDPVTERLPAPPQLLAALLAGHAPALALPVHLHAAGHAQGWFGTRPVAPAFGARPLPAEDGPDGTPHSHYLDPGSPTLAALAAVVTTPPG